MIMENRIIKFRGFSTTDKVFVFGSLNVYQTGKELITNIEGSQSWFVDGKSVGQFTGLKDKNGVEIYEGDVLADANRSGWDVDNFIGYEVFYHDNDTCEHNVGFQMNRVHCYGAMAGTSTFKRFKPSTVLKMEVIGNIYENPDLLK